MSSHTERTSVIIPCYTNDEYLTEALASVRNQTKPVLEILVIDDGSPEPLREPDDWTGPTLRWIRTCNQGLGAARNVGLHESRGEFVAFLDSDDMWHPEKNRYQLDCLDSEPEAVACYTWCIEASGFFPFGPYPNSRLDRDPLAAMLWQGQFFPPSSVMVRRKAALEVGGFREGLANGEDLDFWFRLFTIGEIVGVPERLCWYRVHDGQITSNAVRKILGSKECRREIIEKHADRLERGGIAKSAFWHAYRNEILCVYYRRNFRDARPMLWDYWKDHPDDARMLFYLLVACFPSHWLQALRGRI
jgi:glycosyltransferase involved in cell wall biosynthesis